MDPSYAIITPSYDLDFECCRLLSKSVMKYVPKNMKHYIIIPKQDREKFAPLVNSQTTLVFQDDLMPSWLKPIPFTNKWWLSFKSLPVRGWIRQQIVKLSAAEACSEDFLLFVDSDCFFVKDFQPHLMVDSKSRMPLFSEHIESNTKFQKWYAGGAEILKIKDKVDIDRNYVGPFIFWSRSELESLLTHIEKVNGKDWREVICRQVNFSEYTIYGMFIDYIRKGSPDHFSDDTIRSVNYWPETPASPEVLNDLYKSIQPQHFGGMISAKSGTLLDDIYKIFNFETSENIDINKHDSAV